MSDKEIYSFLDNNESVTAQMYQDVLEAKHRMEMDTDADVISVYESDDGLGIIIDAYCGEENVGTATFWYDDYNS